MLRNYFKIALRNLWKRKTQTLINVLGLSLGIASAIIIFLIIRYELSFDRFHDKGDRIYRVATSFYSNDGNTYTNAGGARPLPDALRQDFADDLEVVIPLERYSGYKKVMVDSQIIFVEKMVAYTENGYFTLFDFPLIAGNRTNVLTQPNEAVITRTLSEKLFGQPQDALGEIINLNDKHELKVVGVLEDYPSNTGFDFSMLISFSTLPRDREEDSAWDNYSSSFQTYVLLSPHVSALSVASRFPDFIKKYQGEEDAKYGIREFHLQPLSSIHLEGNYGDFPYRKTDSKVIYGLIILAILMVLLACINFVNLATAVSTQRSKEIGIRKVVGSSRRQVMEYFMGEALFVTLVAVALALGLTELGLIQLRHLYPFLNAVLLSLDTGVLVFLLSLTLLVTGLAGFYPALLLSRYRPVQMFKATLTKPQRHRVSVRQGLVVFQFFIAQLFIISVLVVGQQLKFLLEAPLGFNQEAILTIDFPDEDTQKQKRFRQSLQNHSGVENLTLSMFTAISQGMSATNFGYDGKDKDESEEYTWFQMADADYFATHQMDFLAGGVYTPSDSGSGFVANESFVRQVGAGSSEEVIGKYVTLNDLNLPIVGVVADYHTNTFGTKIPSLLITNYSPWYSYLSLKVNMTQASGVIAQLETVWQENYSDYPFKYSFLDDTLAMFYEDYQRLLSLTQLFSGIAIAIGCLGLYGLVMFMAESKTKEIGIRKVLGASIQQLLKLFSAEFVKLVLIAFVLAAPLAYYLMQLWLQSFEYRVNIGFAIFGGCLLITLLLVIVTVGYRSIRAANANPVDSLRNE
ncbi:ABC transporter permease [Catalinimonas niigatensis]|uniref:ABC transporter permease n=1 Tax=Catalinimonas niigatensis TaxID=1397264 RepID=UPI002665E418|nr:ABC transporter permease [Catalinimonas niigatensis]WPP48826.1 ABC transporter permease [Catalinimonas niigatensis]